MSIYLLFLLNFYLVICYGRQLFPTKNPTIQQPGPNLNSNIVLRTNVLFLIHYTNNV